ncbi:MAG: glycosyltransferase N-terminal domain-containing protein [Vicingaceae bacterium]|nr:glycosyltransferase N-terminal domain-containing protein [Vicingaceae bacterium]
MTFFYKISIYSYFVAVRIASLFNKKAKLWVDGRVNIFEKIENKVNPQDKIYWFHCASLGEYEQGKPLIEKLKTRDKSIKVLVTFFSPSGYENKKNDALIDYCFYLPFDSTNNAKKLIELIKPEKVFFIKYEFWFYYLKELSQNKIPTYLVSGVFRKSQLFFKWYGYTHREMLQFFTFFFVQNERSYQLINKLGFDNVLITGDTRIDRVYENSLTPKKIPLIEKFKADKKIIVAGSSWQPEEKILCDYISSSDKEFKYIIAPHNVSKPHIAEIEKLLGDSTNFIKYSDATEENITQHTILIVDNIGILANVYQYTDIAFIGGGFKGALHNVLEPASFGNVVLFGKKHSKFHEAEDLLTNQAAYEVTYTDDLIAFINHLLVDNNLSTTQNAAKEYITNGIGASNLILERIF